MEPSFSHFRFYAFTRFQLNYDAKEIADELKTVWKEKSPAYSTVRKWKCEFVNCVHTAFDDAPRSGRPKSARSEENVKNVQNLIANDPKLSTRDISTLLHIDHMTIHRILCNDLQLRNVCSVWVPHALSEAHRQLRISCAHQIREHLASLKQGGYNNYAVMDETWVPFDPLPTKAENKVWIGHDDPRPHVVRPSLTPRKTMLLVAFTPSKRFSLRTTGPNETVNAESFIDFVRCTGNKWRSLRSQPIKLSDIHWQMDNARPHTAAVTKEFFNSRGVTQVWQSPYSPDFNLCDRFLFNWLKARLRQETFESHLEVETAALHEMRMISEETLYREVEKLYEHCQRVIDVGGDYVQE
jgi:transposase